MTNTPLILIVDDNRQLQRVTVRVLSQAGYRTCTADDGQAALRLARSEKPDLILLDVVLPDISGLEVCQQLKADPALAGCFIVMLSSTRIDSPSQIEGLEGGADGYMARPIPSDELLARVRGLLRLKHTEDRLRDSEARYRAVAHSATDAIISADSAGNIVGWNPSAERLFGYTESEVSGQPMTLLLPASYHDEHLAGMARVQAGGERHVIGKTVEVAGCHKDGREFPLELSLAEWQVAAGRFYTAIIRDITDRKQTEEALRELNATLEQRVADRTRRLYEANAQLSELDRLKDDFISRISHELRTPLTNIISYLEMLENGKPEKRAWYLQVLHEQTALLRDLIESLLEVTQQSVNAAGVHVAPTDLNQLASALITEAALRAARRGLTLTSTLTPELPFVSADARLLAQALSKLATNALNYTPTGGTIDFATAEAIDTGATWVTFTIRDSGPGIPPHELAHIFDRFYRGRAAADYKTPGVGLGLSVSRDILSSLGGRLTVDSQPDAGATFTAWLKPA